MNLAMTPEERPGHECLTWYWYLIIFSAVVLFRLICLTDFIVSPYFVPIGGDRALYHNLAVSIFRGEWFGSVFSFLPLYPIFLGFLYKIIGAPNLAAAAICQAVFDGLTGMLVAFLARKYYGRVAAIIAGGGYVLLGTAAAYSLVTMPVSLALLWTALIAALADKWQNNWTNLRAAAVGLLLGCGGQILGSFWLMVIPFAVWIACSTPRTGMIPKFIIGSLVILGAITASLPSLGHNYLIEKKITPVTTHFGMNIYMGNNPCSSGYGSAIPGLRTSAEEMTADSMKLASILSGRPMTGAEANRFWARQALQFWLDAPGQAVILVLRKIHRAVSIRDFDDTGLGRILPGEVRALRLGLVNFGVVWLCACLGFIFFPRVFRGQTVFWIMGLSNLGGMLIAFVTARYRLPLAVLLLPAAGGAIAMLPRFIAGIVSNGTVGIKWPRLVAGLAGMAIAILPHNVPPTKTTDDLNRSIYLSRAGRISEALAHAQKACASQPYSPDAWLVLGNVYVTQSNHEAALQSYERALIIQSNRVDVLFNAGLVLEQMGRKQEACGYYQKVVVLDPRHAKAWLGLALIQRELGDDKKAQEAIEKAAEIVGRQHFQIIEFNRTRDGKY